MLKRLLEDVSWLSKPLRGAVGVISALIILIAFNSWSMPVLSVLERSAFDARAYQFEPVSQDDRILLVVFDDAALVNFEQRSPLPRWAIAEAITALDAMNPKSISIDVLFDQPQPDDISLIEAIGSANTPVFLGYVDTRSNDGIVYEQQLFLETFIEEAAGRSEPVSIRVVSDSDGVIRSWPDLRTDEPPLLASRAAATEGIVVPFQNYTGPIDYRRAANLDEPVFPQVSIELFLDLDSAFATFLAEQVAGKHIIIGGNIVDYDQVPVPYAVQGRATIPGTEVHAHMLAQALDGRRIIPLPSWVNIVPVGLSFVIGILVAGLTFNRVVSYCTTFVIASGLFGLSYAAEAALGNTTNLGVAGWIAALISGFILAEWIHKTAAWEKGRTAMLALHKYLPPDIAEDIVSQPDRLGLQGETREVYVMFTDLEGFTSLCQSVPAASVAEFLNEYLEEISQIVLDHGGTIDKFVGDAVVAFWGAPVAHEDDAERITKAAVAIKRATDAYKGRDIGGDDPVGRTRIGVHFGPAIVGNFGGEGRLQYTALGDTMNVAARLEAANKTLDTSILLSGEAYGQLSGAIPCQIMGQIQVRGRSQPVAIYQPEVDLSKKELETLNASTIAAFSGDGEGLQTLKRWIKEHPDDKCTAGLIERIVSSAQN